MARPQDQGLLQDFLGSASFFASAVQGLLAEQVDRSGADDVTLAQMKLLKLIAHADTHIVRDVAAFLGVSNAAASKAVDKLVRRGLVQRNTVPEDRRAIHLSLTPSGRRVLRRFQSSLSRVLEEIFRPFSNEEVRRARKLLDRVSLSVLENETSPRQACFQCGIFFREDCLLRQAHGRRCHYHVQQEAKARRT